MKHLISLFAVCVTCAVHAAAISWCSNVDLVDNTGSMIKTADGYSFVLACIGDGSSIDYSSAYDNIRDTGSFNFEGSYNEIVGNYGLNSSSDLNGMVYVVLAQKDGDLFYLQNYGAEGTIATYTLTGFEDERSSINGYTFGSGDGFTIGGKVESVPEPTSGLLMLLGMAGLALKRKRV